MRTQTCPEGRPREDREKTAIHKPRGEASENQAPAPESRPQHYCLYGSRRDGDRGLRLCAGSFPWLLDPDFEKVSLSFLLWGRGKQYVGSQVVNMGISPRR